MCWENWIHTNDTDNMFSVHFEFLTTQNEERSLSVKSCYEIAFPTPPVTVCKCSEREKSVHEISKFLHLSAASHPQPNLILYNFQKEKALEVEREVMWKKVWRMSQHKFDSCTTSSFRTWEKCFTALDVLGSEACRETLSSCCLNKQKHHLNLTTVLKYRKSLNIPQPPSAQMLCSFASIHIIWVV